MTILDKITALEQKFRPLKDSISIYQKIIEIGRGYKGLDLTEFSPLDIIKGCQSLMYLKCTEKNGKLYFDLYSDALISKGIAAILAEIYSDEEPEAILKSKPSFLKDLNISTSISPSRANGALAVFTKMQQYALYYLTHSKF